jgi:hypothetical protein
MHFKEKKELAMKRIALITAMVTAIPVAAYASPTVRVADRNVPQQTYVRDRDQGAFTRDHYERYSRSHWASDFRGRWVPLARAYNARTDRQFINVNNARYRKIRIEAVRGEPVVTKIAIEFADQSTQAIELDGRLQAGAGEVIDLNGGVRRVHRIIVYSDPNGRGSYSVYGA